MSRAVDVLVVAGASGGCGTSVVATGLALAAVRAGVPARLLELAPGGDMAGSLGVPAERTLADLGPVSGELDEGHLASALCPHRSGMSVLLGAPGPEAWGADAVTALVRVAALRCRVVVDAGAGPSPAVEGAFAAGAALVVVAPPTVAGARRARVLAGGREAAVVMGVTAGRSELGARAFARASGLTVVGEIPGAPEDAESLASGRWPARRRARLGRAIDALAGAVAA